MQMHCAQHADELLTVAWLNKYMISYNIYDSPGDCINYANKKQGEPAAEKRQWEDGGSSFGRIHCRNHNVWVPLPDRL